jgi:serine phosphatase RsbU (regulator of sigma subunit)
MIVDDEELVLGSLRAMFKLETAYELLTFSDPAQALQELERTKVDLVISDYLMPEITGIDFLGKAKQLQPETVRILLTGFADKENVIRAVNLVGLYQYLEKPWDTEALLLAVRNGLKERGLRNQLREKIRLLDRLAADHKELAERHSFLEKELEMAAHVQQSLFPTEFPSVEGFRFSSFYRACRTLGGDYYDIALNNRQAVLLVSDVSGHGIQAALVSMLLKAIFHDAAARATDPTELLTQMNLRLYRFLPENMFAAAIVVWLEQRTARLRLASAGLPRPFVLRPSKQRLDEIPVCGIPLGMFGSDGPVCFDTNEVNLAPGDTLLMTSDGLGEISANDDEFFQDKQLKLALRELLDRDPNQVIQGLFERAGTFGGGRPLQDDVSLIAVTRVTS